MRTCASSRVNVWCASTWKKSQLSGVSNSGFAVDKSRDIYTSLTYTWKRKGTLSFGLGESDVLSLCENLKETNCYVYFDNFFTNPLLTEKLLRNGIYGIGTWTANRKHMSSLKTGKKMKPGEHDGQACKTLYATKIDGQQIREYMGGVDLSNQIKVSYQVHKRSKFRFHLRIFLIFSTLV